MLTRFSIAFLARIPPANPDERRLPEVELRLTVAPASCPAVFLSRVKSRRGYKTRRQDAGATKICRRYKTKGAIEFPQSRLDASSELGLRRAQLRRRKLKFTAQRGPHNNNSLNNYSTRCT